MRGKAVVNEAVRQHMTTCNPTNVTSSLTRLNVLRTPYGCVSVLKKALWLFWLHMIPMLYPKLRNNDHTVTVHNTTISPALSLTMLPASSLSSRKMPSFLFIFFSSLHSRLLCYSSCLAKPHLPRQYSVVNATLRIPSNSPETLFAQPPPTAFPLYPVS